MADLFLADTRVFTLTGVESVVSAAVHTKLLSAGTRPFMFRVLGTVTVGATGLRGAKSLQFGGAGNLISSDSAAFLGSLLASRYCLQGVVKFTSLASTQCLFSLYHANAISNASLVFDATTGKLKWSTYNGTTTMALTGTTSLLVNSEYHFCVEKDGAGVTRLFLNGAVEASATMASVPANDSNYIASVGGIYNSTANRLTAFLDDVTLDWDVLYGGAFTPPGALPETAISHNLGQTPTGIDTRIRFNAAYVPGGLRLLPHQPLSYVPNAGGNYRIRGTVKEKSAPDNRPLARKVVLHRSLDKKLIAETWSSAADGIYEFAYLSGIYTYYAIAFDHAGNYRGVIADNLAPEAMP